MRFLPRSEVLSLDELERLASIFIRRGIRTIRLTGGEPLVRPGVMDLFTALGHHLDFGTLDDLTLTTNGTQLSRYAKELASIGVKRVNVSLDTRDPDHYRKITRGGSLASVLRGLDAAQDAGLAVKINTVALANDNEDELPDLIAWAHDREMSISLIEVMPMADTGEDRLAQFLPLSTVREALASRFTLVPAAYETPGPSRYVAVQETGGLLGFITPLTNNFCAGCNRVRVSAAGQLALCLGREEGADLRTPLRHGGGDDAVLHVLDHALGRKPERHGFDYAKHGAKAAVNRHMSMTGG